MSGIHKHQTDVGLIDGVDQSGPPKAGIDSEDNGPTQGGTECCKDELRRIVHIKTHGELLRGSELACIESLPPNVLKQRGVSYRLLVYLGVGVRPTLEDK